MIIINFFIGLFILILGLYFLIFKNIDSGMNANYHNYFNSLFSRKFRNKKYYKKMKNFYNYRDLILGIIFILVGLVVIVSSF